MRYLIFAFTMIGLFACSEDPEMITSPEPEMEQGEEIIPSGDENFLTLKSDYIFDDDKLPTFELALSQSALSFLDRDPVAEEYVEGSLTFEGETVSQVGIRYKGSVGAFVNCLTGNDWANPSGSKTCTKLSMKIKINHINDIKFFGLNKLQFHAMNLDESHMRERLAYYLYRSMGIEAPRSIHAKLVINGVYSGIYALVEQIDGRFTRYNYEDGKGNLYKEIWPLNSNGSPFSKQQYIDALKTNEDDPQPTLMMQNFANAIFQASDDSLNTTIEKWMDIDKIISYAAVDRTIRADDGAFHWYCNGGGCSSHNFFWYEEEDAGKMHLIPWDMDNTFENLLFDANPVTPIADAWGETSNNCQPFRYGQLNLSQRSAACDKLVRGWASNEDLYKQKVTALIHGPMSEANTDMLLTKWSNQIRSSVQEAAAAHGDAVSVTTWEAGINRLKTGLARARL